MKLYYITNPAGQALHSKGRWKRWQPASRSFDIPCIWREPWTPNVRAEKLGEGFSVSSFEDHAIEDLEDYGEGWNDRYGE